MDQDGAILVTDPVNDSVFRALPGGERELVVGPSTGLSEPTTLGFLDGVLYVGDKRGIFQVTTNAGFRSAGPQLTKVRANTADNSKVSYVKITSPTVLSRCEIGTDVQVRWAHNMGSEARFRVEMTRDGENFELLGDGVMGTTFDWTVTAPYSDTARFRVTAVDEPANAMTGAMVSDTNDDVVYVAKPIE
jgi:hypothetical protein